MGMAAPSSDYRTIEGFYQWDPAIEVTAQCLNTIFPTEINGADFHVCMPYSTVDGRLVEPTMLYRRPTSYVEVDPANAWGEWKSWDTQDDGLRVPVTINVKRVRLVTHVSTDAEANHAALHLDGVLDRWWLNLRAWIEILTGQDLSTLGDRRRLGPNTVHLWTGTDEGLMNPLAFAINVPIPPQARALTDYGFNLCLQKVAANEVPPTEWLFLRDSRSLHQAHEWRRAVLDAATAAEIAATAWLDAHAPDEVRTQLAAHPKPLGPLSKLFQDNGGTLPDDFVGRLLTPRNHAAHRGHTLSLEESQSAIDTVTELLESTSPIGA